MNGRPEAEENKRGNPPSPTMSSETAEIELQESVSRSLSEEGLGYQQDRTFSEDNIIVKEAVIISCDDSYFKTLPGAVQIIHVICSVVTLVCVTSSGTQELSYLLLPQQSFLRIFVFVLVLSFLTTLVLIILEVTQLRMIFPLNWNFIGFLVFSSMGFLYLIGSSLCAIVAHHYQNERSSSLEWTFEQLVLASCIGFACMMLCFTSSYLSWKSYSGYHLFEARRMPNEAVVEYVA